jgi:phospholipase C
MLVKDLAVDALFGDGVCPGFSVAFPLQQKRLTSQPERSTVPGIEAETRSAGLKSTFDEPFPRGNEDLKETKMRIPRKTQPLSRREKVSVSRILLLAFLPLAAGTAMAQTNLWPYVQHVIIVIQENRTPTNLFLQDQTLINNGAHLSSAGICGNPSPDQKFNLLPDTLGTCYDTWHNHEYPTPDWINMWDNGIMDGACNIHVAYGNCPPEPSPRPCPDSNYTYCPQMTYVQNTVQSNGYGILQPYFDLANQYGFANYMFATNQGPSFPAHQFLFSGTSAPTPPTDTTDICSYDTNHSWVCYQWFDAENASYVAKGGPQGCVAESNVQAYEIDPDTDELFVYKPPDPPGVQAGFPCYSHNSLPTLLDNANPPISWAYYIREGNNGGYNLWNAPAAIDDICQPTKAGGACGPNSLYASYVAPKLPNGKNYGGDYAPILTDIENCNLPQVSWVIPDGNWSDHGGNIPGDGGPSWVAWIVNAVGNSYALSGGKCDYWGTAHPETPPAEPTVILVVWDDWGGLYDDVVPPDCPGPGECSGYNGTNGKQYVYGFRVPLLVIGAYANQGYISGANIEPSQLNCTPPSYCHDFGSILNFVEYAFAPAGTRLGGQYGISGPNWPYADYFAMDYDPTKWATTYSLSDFFNFSPGGYQKFTTINSWYYPEDCFHHPKDSGCFQDYPSDPDNDANETD